jgi:hypothetical protein
MREKPARRSASARAVHAGDRDPPDPNGVRFTLLVKSSVD